MMEQLLRFSKISEYHKFVNLPPPAHPLISLINYSQVQYPDAINELRLTHGYYIIGLKRNIPYKFFYGQQEYDFDEGLMTFIAPHQVLRLGTNPNVGSKKPSGWLLLIHPDFLWHTSLAETIKSYDFFGYSISEALFLSPKEEETIISILKHVEQEYHTNIDQFSQKIIVSQLELLLNYAERFYKRQFITRNKPHHDILEQLESILAEYFDNKNSGLPTVECIASRFNLSSNYLSGMLKSLTGMNTQQHIHHKLIEKAKEQLSITTLPVSEIAYNLGFEHPASFNKLFKNKTEMTPLEFRKSFN